MNNPAVEFACWIIWTVVMFVACTKLYDTLKRKK